MKLRIDRKARRKIAEGGGVLTLDARGSFGCLVTRDVRASIGKPDDPAAYDELHAAGTLVFVRGLIDDPDGGEPRVSRGIVPQQIRVRVQGSGLLAETR